MMNITIFKKNIKKRMQKFFIIPCKNEEDNNTLSKKLPKTKKNEFLEMINLMIY